MRARVWNGRSRVPAQCGAAGCWLQVQPRNPGLRLVAHGCAHGPPNCRTDDPADERADDAAADDEQAVVFAVVYAYGPAKHAADCRADGIADDAAHKHSDPSAATDRSEAPLGVVSEAHPLRRLNCEYD